MYRDLTVMAIAPVLNEAEKVREVVRRTPREIVDRLVIVDDGSTDGSAEAAREQGAEVLSFAATKGVGAAIRAGYRRALDENMDVAVVMAGNNKDAPEEIPLLLEPIAEREADFVQGSRFLNPQRNLGDMPLYRRVATRVHPMLFSAVAGRRVSESTNGFRAVRCEVLRDARIQLDQPWLDHYELEPYLYLSVIRAGYPTTEVPVTKIYPPRRAGQTKMIPFVSWWSILRPLFYVATGKKK